MALGSRQFLQTPGSNLNRELWVHQNNLKKDIVLFTYDMKLDACNFYNITAVCFACIASFEVLHFPQQSDFILPLLNNNYPTI